MYPSGSIEDLEEGRTVELKVLGRKDAESTVKLAQQE